MPFSLAMGAMGMASMKPHPHPHPHPYPQHSYYHNPYKMHSYNPYKHKYKVEVKEVPVTPPLIPTNVAQPGEPGGGNVPTNADEEELSLVPRGLRPVAIFPPYLFPR